MIELKNLAISFAGKEVFSDINLIINETEKIGLIGRNGSGKSTLLKILLGQLTPDTGEIIISKNCKLGYLQQHLSFTHDSVIDEACSVLDEDHWYESWKVEKMLYSLEFTEDDLLKHPSELSGGFQIKLNLAKLLLSDIDILLLDEPTNYLDIVTIRWLKSFLQQWSKGLVLITHDRSFMDSIITHTVIIHRNSARKSPGDTVHMYAMIQQEEELYEKTRINEAKKRQQIEAYISRFRFKATLASRVQSRIKMLNRQEEKTALSSIEELEFTFNFLAYPSKANVVELKDISFGYSEQHLLLQHLSLEIARGDRVGIIGKNGKGKSTLLNVIAGLLQPLNGSIKINPQISTGYFGQTNIDRLNPELNILEEVATYAPELPESKIRQICGQMLFSGDDVFKKIKVLSGGEKSRVTLGKILLQPVNLLLLDEPDHHLDMESCETLGMAMADFPGTIIFVSHNEYFLQNIPNKLIIFLEDRVVTLNGGYDDFLRKGGWEHYDTKN